MYNNKNFNNKISIITNNKKKYIFLWNNSTMIKLIMKNKV